MMKLKPCPFCGESAEADYCRGFYNYRGEPGNSVAIYCSKCECDMSLCYADFPHNSSEELMSILSDAWNRRHSTKGKK